MNNKKVVKNDDVIDIELENNKKVQGKILFTFNENGDQFILYEIDVYIRFCCPLRFVFSSLFIS